MGRFGRCVHVPTILPLAASSMGQLRLPTRTPTLRGQIHVRTFLQPHITCPDIEEVQSWVSGCFDPKKEAKKKRLSWVARGIWLTS